MLACAYRVLTADQLVSDVPTLLCAFLLHTSVDGGGVTIYDGQDTLSGIQVAHVTGLANDSRLQTLVIPALLNNGLYVDIGSNVHDFSIFYIPLRGNSPLRPYAPFIVSESDMSNG